MALAWSAPSNEIARFVTPCEAVSGFGQDSSSVIPAIARAGNGFKKEERLTDRYMYHGESLPFLEPETASGVFYSHPQSYSEAVSDPGNSRDD